VASAKRLQVGELVVLDFGAVVAAYHADMTRTVVLGPPDHRQKEIYNLVLQAQGQAMAGIRPGVTCSRVDALAREVIAAAGYGDCFGHGLGHSVGLSIHERPSFSPKDDTVLEPGMVLTVEPGIYLAGWGGVRIEDLIVVTPEGCELLSGSPRELKSI
jgi:Xaa-Pro aminopeptidase